MSSTTREPAAVTNWQRLLAAGELVLLDGGVGSELRRRGVAMNAAAWSGLAALSHPDVLRAIHLAYIEAGADVIVANTFATSRFLLDAAGVGDTFVAINRGAVEIAKQAREASGKNEVAIAGSLSNLPPNMDPQQYPDASREEADLHEQAELLAAAGVDLIALEMLQDPAHGMRAATAASATGLPVWLGVSARIADGRLTCFNFPQHDFADVLDVLVTSDPAVVNVMHTEISAVIPAIDAVRQRFAGPIGVYPEVRYATSPTWQVDAGATPANFVQHARRWIDRGTRLIGGCCGTTPAHIRALRNEFFPTKAAAVSSH